MAIRFNSVSSAAFNANSAEFSATEKERAHLITGGRFLMMERNGRDNNVLRQARGLNADFTATLADGAGEKSYAEANRKIKEAMVMYCAKRACAQTGEVAPADYQDFLKTQRNFAKNEVFLRTLQGIIRDVVRPMLPVTMSNAMSWLAETVYVPMSQTYELDIQSNDVFMFEDDSWGASRSKGANHLYSTPITLNPTPRTAKATAKWHQIVGNDADLGAFFNSIAAGLYSKITALWVGAMTKALNNPAMVPAALQFTNSSQNWVKAAEKVSMVNGTGYRNVQAYGVPSALSKVMPSGVVNASSVNLDAALAHMLGAEYVRYGYLGEYMGLNLMPIDNALVPGTQNTSMTEIVDSNKIFLCATNGYKPVYIGMEEGSPIQVELSPSQTADMTLDIIVTASMDATPVVANKFAVVNL